MNTKKITTTILVSLLSLSSLSAMEMATTTGDVIMQEKMGMKDESGMMKKDMAKDNMMKKEVMMTDKKMMKGMTPQSNAGNGSRGEHVTALQDFLIEKGFLVLPEGATKGYFGMATKKALMKYQKSVGVNPTGYFGPKTRMMVQEKMGMKEENTMMKKDMISNDIMSSDGKMKKDTMAQ